ncbi:choline dehydrogenase [Baekduia soli]|uniref:Choline dehydrogenase n=1 Tax=Baekduia soli TaxID=496014 RepID=A0A5B8U2U6_9ACTN|nr:GMC family oxidoreductase N-terminal domain-containing protein [Baekduia soli]QEC47346.1 choline dehydrogenase [Baekduia soli]
MASADYVIAGAGSAGCVLANRLTEDPSVRVILVEAGGRDRHPNIKIPAAFAKQFHTNLDWDFATDPEPHCDGRSLFVPRGKALGGSSSMNAMLYVRGRPLDYDLWERDGAAGWGWDAVRPYFLKAENNERGASEHHAVGGPLNVADERSPRPLTARFLAAAEQTGIPRIADYNGPEQDGASLCQVTQRNGRRWSTADAYLRPALGRPNLEVRTGAHVARIALDGDRATGVVLRGRRGREEVIAATREVLLCAGAIGSPQLLMLSGIGPAEHLRAHGVGVAVDAPAVGENLQDHPYVVCVWEATVAESLYGADRPKPLLEWLLRRSGPLTSTVAEAFAFVRSRPGLPAADLQYHFAPAYFVDNGAEEFDGHAFTMGPVLVSPKSRGSVRLRSADPADKPRILTNTLAEPEDVAALVTGVELAREIAAAQPLSSITAREIYPGPGTRDDADVEAFVRRTAELLYHPSGTCRMGGEDAVLDPELRVRGVEGLRVVDASVFPVIPGGNTNAPTIMVAERAADLVRGRVRAPAAAQRES